MELKNLFRGLKGTLVALSAIAAAPLASAGMTDVVFSIKAENSDGVAEYQLTMDELGGWQRGSDTFEYSSGNKIDVRDSDGDKIFSLSNVSLFFRADPQINLSFAVQAGGVDTAFTITSGTLSFTTIQNADGQASSAFTVTDTNNNGATLTGDNGDGNAYNTYYNGTGNLFSGQVAGLSVPAGSRSRSTGSNDPASGYRSVGADVSDMTAQVKFELTARDLASGTTQYEIVPEPSAMLLLSLGALCLIRRK